MVFCRDCVNCKKVENSYVCYFHSQLDIDYVNGTKCLKSKKDITKCKKANPKGECINFEKGIWENKYILLSEEDIAIKAGMSHLD